MAIVLQELAKIPKIKGNLPQNLFRLYYYAGRQHDLKKGTIDKKETFYTALQAIRQDYPNFTPTADVKFFTGYGKIDDFLKGMRRYAHEKGR